MAYLLSGISHYFRIPRRTKKRLSGSSLITNSVGLETSASATRSRSLIRKTFVSLRSVRLLFKSPAIYLADTLFAMRPPLISRSPSDDQPPLRLVCMTDTHDTFPVVPDGDVLLHGGDLTNNGTFAELQAQLTWLNSLSHPYKIVIPGNHDLLLDRHYFQHFPEDIGKRVLVGKNGEGVNDLDRGGLIILINESVTLNVKGRKLKIFGSPQTVRFGTGGFTYPHELGHENWHNLIPVDTDIVLTHGPQRGHRDRNGAGYHQGCAAFNEEMWRVRPSIHVHGHIHEGRGQVELCWDELQAMHDHLVNGKGRKLGRALSVTKMIGILAWSWCEWWMVRKKRASTTIVNAAISGRDGIGGGPPQVIEF